VKLSIIIPTLEEEEYVGQILEQIEGQEYENYEVIVSDSGSEDRTVEIAEERGAEVVKGPKEGPGKARNLGAEKSGGEYLLFLDSDVKLADQKVLGDVVEALEEDEVVAGTSTWRTFDGNLRAKLMFSLGSMLLYALHKTDLENASSGNFLFVEAETFGEIGGFDASMPFHEDHEFIKRAKKRGKIKLLNKRFYASGRRVRQKGFLGTLKHYYEPSLTYLIRGKDKLRENYRFEAYGEQQEKA
jgi:glycosyltransferase involved in cell wall biosynthesis